MKKIILSIFMVLIIALGTSVYGAASISVSSTSVTTGSTITVTAKVTNVATASMNISASGPVTFVSGTPSVIFYSDDNNNASKTITATYKATGVGTATFTFSGDSTEKTTGKPKNEEFIETATVTIKAPVVEQPTKPTTPSTPTNTKSNNAKLKRLVPDFEGLSPNFNPDVTRYTLIVPSTADSINLSVATADSKAKYWISGDDNLKIGDNTVTVTVTAEDGTKKVYTIIVTKADDVKKANALLSSIIVDGVTLSPNFAPETLEYDLGTVSKDITEILVLAYAEREGAKVEITGNKDLVDGENIIKIKVTAEDGKTTKEYKLKVVKEAAPVVEIYDEVEIYEEEQRLEDTSSKLDKIIGMICAYVKEFWLVLSLFAVCLIELWEIIYLYRKINRLKKGNIKVAEDSDFEVDKPRRRGAIATTETVSNVEIEPDELQDEIVEDISDELISDSKEVVEDPEDITDNFEDIIEENKEENKEDNKDNQ
jgi:hypothetical protein